MPDGLSAAPTDRDRVRPDRPSFAAFVRDAASEEVVRRILLPDAGPGAVLRRGDLGLARTVLQGMHSPAILLVDVSEQANPLLALEQLADAVEPGTVVLVIGDRNDMGFYREVTRGLGAAEYLYKPLNQEMTGRHFLPFLNHHRGNEPGLRSGRVVTVTGVRGGVGASTVASNLALYIAERTRRRTVLVDADLARGTAALLLGVAAGGGLRGALEAPDRVDELFLERAVRPVGDRLSLLAAEEALDQRPSFAAGAGASLVEALRRTHNLVVIDLPAAQTRLADELMTLAHQRVFVLEPTLAGVRDALRFAALPNAPGQTRRPVMVLNRDAMPGALTRARVSETLQAPPDVAIPFLPQRVVAAATMGEPAVRRPGRFQDAIRALAGEIVPDVGGVARPGGRLRRLLPFGRRR